MKKYILLLLCSSLLFSQEPTRYAKENARPSEEWVKNGIIYEIYPRAFSKEGNFAGIEKKLPELKALGVTILWLMPIHPIGEKERKGSLGSPYSIKDYYGINPEYGTLDDFSSLLTTAHKEGFKLIIDLVANHTSWDSKLSTEHPEWFTKDTAGKFIPPVPDWSDVIDLNYTNPELRRYMIEMMKYWVRDVGIDGFRCDVAEMVPIDFWNEARAAIDSIKPVVMLAEGQSPEFHLKAFDVTYSWNFYNALKHVLAGKELPSVFDSILSREASAYPKNSLRMRFSSNHDENASDNPDVVKFGKDGAKLAAVLVNTFPGVPLLYNGQEVGSDKKLGLFEKFEIDWTKGEQFREFYTKLFGIRKANPALDSGKYQMIRNDHSDAVYAFVRTTGKNTVLALFNFSDNEQTATLELPKVFSSLEFTDAFTGSEVNYKNVRSITLPAYGYTVFIVE
jgi:glycosidase